MTNHKIYALTHGFLPICFVFLLLIQCKDKGTAMGDYPLKGTPCYYSYKWKNLFYRKNDSISVSMIDPRQDITDIFWNNQHILFINKDGTSSLIELYEELADSVDINWFVSSGSHGNIIIDLDKMNHVEL